MESTYDYNQGTPLASPEPFSLTINYALEDPMIDPPKSNFYLISHLWDYFITGANVSNTTARSRITSVSFTWWNSPLTASVIL